jgi:S1-C subfamily serine protease
MKSMIAAMAILAAVIMAVDVRKPYDKAVSSTVWIEAGDGSGTGVFVGEKLILTAHHVVVGQPVIRAHSPIREDGAVVSAASRYKRGMACVVIACDPDKDLALLRVEGTGKPMALARGEAAPGDPLFAIGCGDGTALFGFSCGYVRQVYLAEYPRQDGTFSARVMDTTVTVNLGDSGGPVVDSSGNLAGIISGIDAFKNQTYLAVSDSEIRAFLNSSTGR